MARVDYDAQAARYDAGRTLPDEAVATWMVAARRHAPEVHRILDLGSGTGRFSAALADAFGADVVGVEPSAGMRAQAAPKAHDRVAYVGGAAEEIPVASGTIDLAWLSNVIHHFDDLDAAAAEVGRVLRPGGVVLIRGAFGGRCVPSLYRFFPTAQAIVDSMPTVTDAIWSFERVGFASFYSEQVSQLLANSLGDMIERIRMRADTTLELISDEEFERGLHELEETAKVEDGPVIDPLDLLVIR
jgi:ubiquinone/menaquinone biosynthesis C-methylase UbiE